jgi:preprotein translocase subunit YajC
MQLKNNHIKSYVIVSNELKIGDKIKFPSGLKAEIISIEVKVYQMLKFNLKHYYFITKNNN